MNDPDPSAVWVSGARWNVDHLLDRDTGAVLRTLELESEGGETAGMGRWIGRRFVAVYVESVSFDIVLQHGPKRLVLDQNVRVRYSRSLGGFRTVLVAEDVSGHRLDLSNHSIGRVLQRATDPAYDDLDALSDDFLADIANVASNRQRRDWLRESKNPLAGPWSQAAGSPE